MIFSLCNRVICIVIFTGDEEAGVTSNNHVSQEEDNHVETAAASSGGGGESSHKKEKSVLQAKLTKLAIQVYVYFNLMLFSRQFLSNILNIFYYF